MLAGLLITVAYVFTYLGIFFLPETNFLPNTPDAWLFGIAPASFGTVGAVINFLVAYVVSNATEAPPKHIQDLVESVRIPRGAGAAQAH
jgi:cation/acetate symporter